MSTLTISFHLYRSNPIILRVLTVPQNFTADELPQLCCISLGLNPTDCHSEMLYDSAALRREALKDQTLLPEISSGSTSLPGEASKEQALFSEISSDSHSPNQTISEKQPLFPGMSGTIRLAKDLQTANFFSLDVYWSITDGQANSVNYPLLNRWIGFQLPAGIFNISVINDMQAVLLRNKIYQSPSGELLYRDDLLLTQKKVENAICKRYAPNQAKAEIRMEYGISAPELLDSITLPELKKRLDDLHHYGFQSQKKAYCIAALADIIQHTNIDNIFAEMELDEYLRFRQLVLTGTTSCENNDDLMLAFPLLYSQLRIRFVKKQGIRISRDILLDYAKWFDTPQEPLFRVGKRILQAMCWCCFYYAIFSMEQCFQVLQAVCPQKVKKEDLVAFWENPPVVLPAYLRFTGPVSQHHSIDDYVYDTRIILDKEKDLYLAAIRNDSSRRKLPSDLESFEEMAKKSLHYSDNSLTIRLLAAHCPYYSDEKKIPRKVNQAIDTMRGGNSYVKAAEDISHDLYWNYGHEQDKAILTEYLKEEADQIPQYLYYGFTQPEVEKEEIVSYLYEQLKILKEKQALQKRNAKKAAQKASSSTASRKWGRK